MTELLEWLRNEKGGVRTFYDFQGRALALREQDPDNAGLARLLADLSGRFADFYDGQPLHAHVADAALARLISYVERAVEVIDGTSDQRLALSNEIGMADPT